MTGSEIIFLGVCLSLGAALAVWARWSRHRFERKDPKYLAK